MVSHFNAPGSACSAPLISKSECEKRYHNRSVSLKSIWAAAKPIKINKGSKGWSKKTPWLSALTVQPWSIIVIEIQSIYILSALQITNHPVYEINWTYY